MDHHSNSDSGDREIVQKRRCITGTSLWKQNAVAHQLAEKQADVDSDDMLNNTAQAGSISTADDIIMSADSRNQETEVII